MFQLQPGHDRSWLRLLKKSDGHRLRATIESKP
jgi:hypothetical protein